jgi:predicted enzyme related to lactoylglutathione lyase
MAVRAETFAEGVPCWADAMLSDVEAGKRFYGELFGWTFGDGEPGRDGYTTAYAEGRHAAGLFAKSDGRLPTVWNLYLATEDAAVAVARIREAGGDVLTEPAEAAGPSPYAGTVVSSLVADPSGAVFGLMEPGVTGGFGIRGEHGTYYGMRDLGDLVESERDADFTVWAAPGDPVDDDHAIGGRGVIGGAYPAEMPSHFLTYFAVDDCDAAAHTTVRLGGRVQHEPEETPHGRYAVLIDDQGASFAVLRVPRAASASAA